MNSCMFLLGVEKKKSSHFGESVSDKVERMSPCDLALDFNPEEMKLHVLTKTSMGMFSAVLSLSAPNQKPQVACEHAGHLHAVMQEYCSAVTGPAWVMMDA